MKQIFILAFTCLALNAAGQSPVNQSKGVTVTVDTSTALKVVYVQPTTKHRKPAYFVNGKFAGENLLNSLNPNHIDSIHVDTGNVKIDDVLYHGKIRIKTKENYAPKPISLNDLKAKYTNLKSKASIFMIDGNVINADYDKYIVDESYILRIIVDKIANTKENIDLNLIKLLTRSEANLKKASEIMIRGTE